MTSEGPNRVFVDLHCHTAASFDSLAAPRAVAAAAARRGLTHLLVTDHDRIDGALAVRDAAPAGLTVIVGEEVRTADGDLIAAFLSAPVEPDRSAVATIGAIRDQGGLVGMPHPYDRFRGSLVRGAPNGLEELAGLVDWIEVHNARLLGSGNLRAAELAILSGRPGVAVSDAHTTLEVAVACTSMVGDPATPAGLLAALAGPRQLVRGRASYVVRLWTPVATTIQQARGNGRVSRASLSR